MLTTAHACGIALIDELPGLTKPRKGRASPRVSAQKRARTWGTKHQPQASDARRLRTKILVNVPGFLKHSSKLLAAPVPSCSSRGVLHLTRDCDPSHIAMEIVES